MIVHVHDCAQIPQLVRSWPKVADVLLKAFMPGPLTLVLEKSDLVSSVVSGGLDTIGIRMPDHKVALNLIKLAGVPIAAPSANRSGRPSPTLASHVIEDLDGRVDCIIDGGQSDVGLESTVLDLTNPQRPCILRPGKVTREQLLSVLGDMVIAVDLAKTDEVEKPKSPGMKYKHYAPKAPVYLLEGDVRAAWQQVAEELSSKKLGLYASLQLKAMISTLDIYKTKFYPSHMTMDAAAHDLFLVLRDFDHAGCEAIVVEALPAHELGVAFMNRVLKAASYIADGREIKAIKR